MFTGIIEEIGVIKNITANSKSGKITILANKIGYQINNIFS